MLLQDFLARTPAVVEQVQREVPGGLSRLVLNKVLSGPLRAAKVLEAATNKESARVLTALAESASHSVQIRLNV